MDKFTIARANFHVCNLTHTMLESLKKNSMKKKILLHNSIFYRSIRFYGSKTVICKKRDENAVFHMNYDIADCSTVNSTENFQTKIKEPGNKVLNCRKYIQSNAICCSFIF